jgi:hypothetical protein
VRSASLLMQVSCPAASLALKNFAIASFSKFDSRIPQYSEAFQIHCSDDLLNICKINTYDGGEL